jgi:Uma2 family endonuclease
MPAATLISLEKYLKSSYEPDCDYVDGVLEERNLGEFDHSNLQTALAVYMRVRAKRWNVRVCTELRVRVSATRVRVPDICVIDRDPPVEQVPSRPPLLCIEVRSPEDRWKRVEIRIEDFLAMGVPCVWVFDPTERKVYEYTPVGRRLVTEETLEAPPISIHLPDLYADLD